MKINQFSIIKTSPQQEEKELQQLHLLDQGDLQLEPTALWQKLLTRVHTASQEPAAIHQWFYDLLASPQQSLEDWFSQRQPLTDQIFYVIALQLLHFEAGLDFDPADPLAAINKLNMPHRFHDQWTNHDVVDAWYLLLATRGKNGQSFIDDLTSQGLFTWTYQLPAKQKPLWFNGKSLACFDPHKFIREVVYVETDQDSDFDGKADLVKAEIVRPADTEDGLKVPVAFTASPYNEGTNDKWGEIATHDVNQKLSHKPEGKAQSPDEMMPQLPQNHQKVNGEAHEASETFSETPGYTLNFYLAVRGYAIVYSAGIGTRDSDGLLTCGDYAQVNSMKAVIEWLHGDRKAFTDRSSGIQIKAWWCNGNVAMTGRSYLGTLATAVATTGVTGLKAIISEAAISSWYDYYRENGLVVAPGGFQGEDADVLCDECFSRTKRAADYQRIEGLNSRYIKAMQAAEDRETGSYNKFWAARNYRINFEHIKCDVMMVHGLNDWNVKPVNVKRLYDALQGLPVANHLILHQGQHIYINAFRSLDFSEMVNLWLGEKLWGQHSHADEVLPRVLVQDNVTPETWTPYQNWSRGQKLQYFFNKHSMVDTDAVPDNSGSFNDHQDPARFKQWCSHIDQWQRELVSTDNKFSIRLFGPTADHDTLLRGTPMINLRVASSKNYGMVSAQLLDFGDAHRLTISPQLINQNGLPLGYQWKYDNLREFKLQKAVTPYKVISYGHINLQNRHGAGVNSKLEAKQMVDIKLPLQPIFHHLVKGHSLLLVIFSTDFGMTLRGNDDITYTVDLGNSSLTIPSTVQLN